MERRRVGDGRRVWDVAGGCAEWERERLKLGASAG